MAFFEGEPRAPQGARFAILATRWNPGITDPMLAAARETLRQHGVAEADTDVVRVPGAWELPMAAATAAASGSYAALVALGCVVRGDTRHYEHVADECARGLMQVALNSGVPVANGVLATETHAHAEARAGGAHGNKGEECALAIIEMTNLFARIGQPAHLRAPAGPGPDAPADTRRAPDRGAGQAWPRKGGTP
jgi:6,7-dimethyl-8-ribityllumazine synthase